MQLFWALKSIQDNMNSTKQMKDEIKGIKAEIKNIYIAKIRGRNEKSVD